MNLEINNEKIEESFDRIAEEILTSKAIYVNDIEFRFTEIEFYYFHEKYHPDNYTHEHLRKPGEWRFHNQGLDITFRGDEKSDGGILIRGVLVDGEYINGPRKIVAKIFESFDEITKNNSFTLKNIPKQTVEILKTFRHLPSKNIEKDYHRKPYRYLIDIDNLSISSSIKEAIKRESRKI